MAILFIFQNPGFSFLNRTLKINIYAKDNRHQNEFGAYLSALCHVRSIYKINVSKCTEFCGLNEIKGQTEEQKLEVVNKCKALLSAVDKII